MTNGRRRPVAGRGPLLAAALLVALLAGPAWAAGETVFLSLEEVWALAEIHHPAVREARREVAALERTLAQREAAYAPSLTVRSEGLGVRIRPEGDADPFRPGVSLSAGLKLPAGLQLSATVTVQERATGSQDSNVRGTLNLSYPLFRDPSLDEDALARREAAVSLEAGRRRLEEARQQARVEALAALRETAAAARRLELAEAAYADAVRVRGIVEQQAAAGTIAESDLLAADVELLRAEQERAVAQRTYETRRAQLLRLLGLAEDQGHYEFEIPWDWLAMPPVDAVEAAVARAVARSVDVWERREAVETARLQLAAERARSGLETHFSVSYMTRGQQEQDREQPGWQVVVQASYPLLDGGQRRLAVASREDAVARAQEALEEARRDVQQQVEELMFQLEDARRQVEIARLELARAELEWTAVQRQLALPVPAATPDQAAAAQRARARAELAWQEATWAYQNRWLELQILQGAVDWSALSGE